MLGLQSSGYSEGVTPVPIPNTVVKSFCADGTWWVTAWESKSLLVLHKKIRFFESFLFLDNRILSEI